MLKSYFKYNISNRYGIVTQPYSPIYYADDDLVVTCSKYELSFWNSRTKELMSRVPESPKEVENRRFEISTFTFSLNRRYLALGTTDGIIQLYAREGKKYALCMKIKTHNSAVNHLHFGTPPKETTLVSAGRDTDIVVYDVLSSLPLFRLRGHKDEITGVHLLSNSDLILSTSKDGLLKVWEIDTQHCVQTIKPDLFSKEIWAMGVDKAENRLVLGGRESKIGFWDIEILKNRSLPTYQRIIQYVGHLTRNSHRRVCQISIHSSGRIVAVSSGEKYVELFHKRSLQRQVEERAKMIGEYEKLQEVRRKQQINLENTSETTQEDVERILAEELENYKRMTAHFEFEKFPSLRTDYPVLSTSFHTLDEYDGKVLRFLAGTQWNTVEEWDLRDPRNFTKNWSMEFGHENEILDCCLSSDRRLLASVSSQHCWVSQIRDGSFLRSFPNVGRAFRVVFLPGNQYVLIATIIGELKIYDFNTSELIEYVKDAHGNCAIRSLVVRPDKNGIVTAGSSDQAVKFWNFGVKRVEGVEKRQIRLNLVHTIQMREELICLAVSPKGTYIATSVVGNTVQVFYQDTMKFYLSLYGHHLPVLCIDISQDEFMCVTGSGDKNFKIWSLQFGNCLRSVFAHDGPLTSVRFLGLTHHLVTCSRDGGMRRWDGDKNSEKIQDLLPQNASRPLHSVSVSKGGELIVCVGQDRCVFVLEESEADVLYLDEEKEKRVAEGYEEEMVKSQEFDELDSLVRQGLEHSLAGERTSETIRYGDELMDALKLMDDEEQKLAEEETENYTANPRLMGMQIQDFFWWVLGKIRREDLRNVLTVLPYAIAVSLIRRLERMFRKEKEKGVVKDIELVCRIVTILLGTHRRTIMRDVELFEVVKNLSAHLKEKLGDMKEKIGFNNAAVQFEKKRVEGERYLRKVNQEILETEESFSKKRKRKPDDLGEMEKMKKKLKLK